MKDCNNCKHKDCWEYADPCNSCTDVNDTREPTNWEAQTNYDRLISKSPEELAEWLAEVLFHCSNTICDERCPMYKCCCDQPNDNIEDWLKQEAKE